MLAGSMPKFRTASVLVETAAKWCCTADLSPSDSSSQPRAVWALVNVSIVVKVFEATMNRVSAGSRSCVASQMSVPSTFDTKRTVSERSLKSFSAS
jgi:hypothetical protein